MFSCSRTETKLINEGRCCGVVRRYPPNECPHKPGSLLQFSSSFLPEMPPSDNTQVVFATATIVSVRPGTVASFRKDDMLARQDGFENGPVWHGHLNQYYKGIPDDASVYHITFRIDSTYKTKQ